MNIKSYLPRSLLGRSLLILAVPVVIVQIVTTFVFFDRHWGRVITAQSAALAGEVSAVAELYEVEQRAYADMVAARFDIEVYYDQERMLPEISSVVANPGWESFVADIFVQELENLVGRPFVLKMLFGEKRIELDLQLGQGVLMMTFPQRRLFSSSGYIYLLWVFGSAMILLIVAVLFMRNQVRPIRKLAAAAERFGRGRDVQFFKSEGAREVRQAGAAFMSMYKRIRRQVEQRTLMLAGVSHDLRTPITRLKLQLAMMGDGQDVADMGRDIDDMERMIEGYLHFVRGEGDEEERQVDLAGLLRKLAGQVPTGSAEVIVRDLVEVELPLRLSAMERCFSNILSNAARYGAHIYVSATSGEDQRVHIVIEDDGPGVPEEAYSDLFKPFYRHDPARGSAEGSVGLGLSIAMDAVHAHGGRIWLEPSQYGGLAVHIRLPV